MADGDDGGGDDGSSEAPPAGRGYGRNGLQRWFMANLFNRFAARDAAVAPAGSDSASDAASAMGGGEADDGTHYPVIVATYAASLAGAFLAAYVCGLDDRRPADVLVTRNVPLTLLLPQIHFI